MIVIMVTEVVVSSRDGGDDDDDGDDGSGNGCSNSLQCIYSRQCVCSHSTERLCGKMFKGVLGKKAPSDF